MTIIFYNNNELSGGLVKRTPSNSICISVLLFLLILEADQQFADDVRGEEHLDPIRVLGVHGDGLAELDVPHSRREALQRERPGRLGLRTELVPTQDDAPVLERGEDAHVDARVGRGLDRVDPRVVGVPHVPRPIRDVARALGLKDHALDATSLDHIHQDVGRGVSGHHERHYVLLKLGVEAEALDRGDGVLAMDAVHDHDLREGFGHRVTSGRVERREVGLVALADTRAVEHVAEADAVDAHDAVPQEGLADAHGVRHLHGHIRARLLLGHLRADHEDRLLQRQLEEHGQERTGLRQGIRAMQDDEHLVVVVGRRDHLAHHDPVVVHDVGRVLPLREVLERQLDALGEYDPLKQLGRGLRGMQRIPDHPQSSSRVKNVCFLHLRFLPQSKALHLHTPTLAGVRSVLSTLQHTDYLVKDKQCAKGLNFFVKNYYLKKVLTAKYTRHTKKNND